MCKCPVQFLHDNDHLFRAIGNHDQSNALILDKTNNTTLQNFRIEKRKKN